jgi:hypothetical protein
MVVHGYVKGYKYAGDGTLLIQTRIPSIHGPMNQREYKGKTVRNYTIDEDLPYYQSLLLPHLPNEGEVVALISTDDKTSKFIIIGLTGGSYYNNITDGGNEY